MRISDWSSDVCSSDLNQPREPPKRKTRGCRHPRTLACSIRRRNDFRRRSGAFHPQAASSPFAASRTRAPRSGGRSEEHTSELQSLMRISYAVFCLKKKNNNKNQTQNNNSYHTYNTQTS